MILLSHLIQYVFFYLIRLFFIKYCLAVESPPSQSTSDQSAPPPSKIIEEDVSLQ